MLVCLTAIILAWLAEPAIAASADPAVVRPVYVFGIPVDFILFGLTLLGVAVFHHYTLQVALTGLAAITIYKVVFTGFKFGAGLAGFAQHMQHEWVILANLFLLLMGFALLSRHFEKSRVPDEMPAYLPDDWKGGFALLAIVFILSGFLDNIAAALIGGTMARHVFRGKVHIGYLAAIVAASNAGGAGSVVGDTTTTMMWIDGISPLLVLDAYIAAAAALLVFAIPAALAQHRYSPIVREAPSGPSDRMGARRYRGGDPGGCDCGECYRQSALPGHPRRAAGAWLGGLVGHSRHGADATARLGDHAGNRQGDRSSSWRWSLALR